MHNFRALDHRLELGAGSPTGGLAESTVRRDRDRFRWGDFQHAADAAGLSYAVLRCGEQFRWQREPG